MVNQYSSTAMLVAFFATTAAADTFVPRGPNDTLENRAAYKARQTISRTSGDIPGCMGPNALNYNAAATIQQLDQYGNDDCVYASCEQAPDGCMYADSFSVFTDTFSDADCATYGGIVCTPADTYTNTNTNLDATARYGCLDENAVNYNADATTDELNTYGDVKCIYDPDCSTVPQDGCVYADAFATYTADFDSSDCATYGTPCTAPISGCTDATATNYDPTATVDDGSCATAVVNGCTDDTATNYDPTATVDDGSCATAVVNGCTDPTYVEYDAAATVDDNSCATLVVNGCTDDAYTEYDAAANTDDNSCLTPVSTGGDDTGSGSASSTVNAEAAKLVISGNSFSGGVGIQFSAATSPE